jgi:tRNA-2-methylthio-N6-dimethylallyladenosine synthase
MPKRIHIETFGCQMNVHDSERLVEVMTRAGWEPTPFADIADLIVFNTCSIREGAENKLHSAIGRLRPLKERRSGLVIAVGGCVAQQEGDRLFARAPHLDVVFGPDDIPKLPDLVSRIQQGFPPVTETQFDTADPFFLPVERPADDRRASAYVTIMKGCDERCTFCIVPSVRGPERYRPADEIVDEVRRVCAGHVCEVVLLGQTVNSYDGGCTFTELLERLDGLSGLRRLRYTSPHPRHVGPALASAHARLRSLCEHVHLPVQSGSSRILRRMKRRHDRAEYLERVRLLREARPDLGLTTDFIVGFPTETEEDFRETLSLVEEVRFDAAFSFKYSARPGTPALKLLLEDDVPEAEKASRLRRLQALVDGIAQGKRKARVGEVHEVLVVGGSKRGGGQLTGRTRRNDPVNFQPPEGRGTDLVGALVAVELVRATPHAFEGVHHSTRRGARLVAEA